MTKIKVMTIAAYEGLRELVNSMSGSYPEMEIATALGDLESAVPIALQAQKDGYDVILSRGGTADYIEQKVTIPVIRIKVSGYDFLRNIKLTDIVNGKIAYVGFHDITKNVSMVAEMLQKDLDVFSIESYAECENIISKLGSQGYQLVMGDVTTKKLSTKYGMNCILVTSGRESVEESFTEIQTLHRMMQQKDSTIKLFAELFRHIGEPVAVFNSEGSLIQNTYSQNDLKKLLPEMKQRLASVFTGPIDFAYEVFEAPSWRLLIRKISFGESDKTFAAFFGTRVKPDAAKQSPGIQIINYSDQENSALNLFARSDSYSQVFLSRAERLSKSDAFVLITGETGTKKDILARAMHFESSRKYQPFMLCDCGLLSDENVQRIIYEIMTTEPDRDGTVLKQTIYLKNVQNLSMQMQIKLYAAMSDVQKNNRYTVYASGPEDLEALCDKGVFLRDFLSEDMFSRLHLTPLRERINDIPSMCGIMIGKSNERWGKQVMGIEPQAMESIKAFPWAGNASQLERVIDELVLLSTGPFLTNTDVKNVLQSHAPSLSASSSEQGISISGKTLDEITADVIRTVLAEEDMNHSRAARRLGIGRSTLWRKIQQ